VIAFSDPTTDDFRAPGVAWHVTDDGQIDPERYQQSPGALPDARRDGRLLPALGLEVAAPREPSGAAAAMDLDATTTPAPEQIIGPPSTGAASGGTWLAAAVGVLGILSVGSVLLARRRGR
jgi:hypothetical protein